MREREIEISTRTDRHAGALRRRRIATQASGLRNAFSLETRLTMRTSAPEGTCLKAERRAGAGVEDGGSLRTLRRRGRSR